MKQTDESGKPLNPSVLPEGDNKSAVSLSEKQLHVLQHSLGVDQYGQGAMYRNHFCAGDDDEPICRDLVALGYMKTFTRSYLPYYNCTVTEAGKRAMIEASPTPPKLTRGQQRYREFLRADSGMSFREWLEAIAMRSRVLSKEDDSGSQAIQS